MQTEAARRNGMVHTAALPHTSQRQTDVRGVDTQISLRFSLAKAASHGLHHRVLHKNGLVASPVVEVIARRTEAVPSSSSSASTRQGSLTELAPSPTDSRISTPVEHIRHHSIPFVSLHTPSLSQKQSDMEQRLASSLGRLRHRQLEITLTHSASQLKHSALPQVASVERPSSSSLTSLSHSSPCWSPGMVVDPLDSSGVSSLDTSCMSSVAADPPLPSATSNVAGALSQHLAALEQTVDDELTCSSSDEEVDEETSGLCGNASARKSAIKQRWERDRVKIGSQWSWLCHQVTSLNQQLRQAETHFHSHPPKEAVQFAMPGSVSFPCICGLPNGQGHDLLPKGNGSLLSSLHKAGTKPGGGNGSVSPCTCNIKKMLLANPNLMGQQLQVRDLLGYSFPVLFMDESTQTCARTRMLRRAPRRRILRKEKRSSVPASARGVYLDPSHHPYLSQPTEFPSSLWLDTAINRILQEHSYASIPLCKRRRPAVMLPPVESTPISWAPLLRMQRSKSFSPSPSPLDAPCDKTSKALGPRKRMGSHIPYLDDDYHPSTPTLPLSARRKKGVSTPSFDIDNIVIPYSMASSTRLEKLEYKEIITPKWREIEGMPLVRRKCVITNGQDANRTEEEKRRKTNLELVHSPRPHANRKLDLEKEKEPAKPLIEEREVEDASEAVFVSRHLACEEAERKRYLNFITGNTRKRTRAQASTPDSAHAHPIPPDGEAMFIEVLPWPPRKFHLTGADLSSLTNPLPPPKKIIRYVQLADRSHSASPSPLPHPLSTTPSHPVTAAGNPLNSASTAVTPLTSPSQVVSPSSNSPDAESPLSQWTVTPATRDKVLRQSNIVLKISRR